MIKTFLRKFTAVLLLLMLPATVFLTVGGSAVHVSAQTRDDVCDGVEFAGGKCDAKTCGTAPAKDCASNELAATVKRIVDIVSTVVGIASVIMIMFGGFRYITAGGDSGKISTAQQTIIYAIVGLVVVGFAQVLIRFVIEVTSVTP